MNKAVQEFIAASQRNEVKKYSKFGFVWARPAIKGEKIVTTIKGQKETENTAKAGNVVVINPTGEQYIIDGNKFKSRYSRTGEVRGNLRKFEAKGFCFAFQYKGKPFKFIAPWQEEMICNTNDYIASTGPNALDDVYRIELEAFKKTYKLA